MPIDGVLKEACRKVGGVRELARRLNVTKQAINGFSIDGFSDERIKQISEIANISRDRLRRYSEEKASAKYDRAESERQFESDRATIRTVTRQLRNLFERSGTTTTAILCGAAILRLIRARLNFLHRSHCLMRC